MAKPDQALKPLPSTVEELIREIDETFPAYDPLPTDVSEREIWSRNGIRRLLQWLHARAEETHRLSLEAADHVSFKPGEDAGARSTRRPGSHPRTRRE